MQRNLFLDLLAHKSNGYRNLFPTDTKYYLSRITKGLYNEVYELVMPHAL